MIVSVDLVLMRLQWARLKCAVRFPETGLGEGIFPAL